MNCTRITLPGGLVAVVCVDQPRFRRCVACAVQTRRYKLCDYPVGAHKTCDVPLCTSCAVHREPDTD